MRLEIEARMAKVTADADEKLKQGLANAKLEVSLILQWICNMIHDMCDRKNREVNYCLTRRRLRIARHPRHAQGMKQQVY